MNSYTLFDSIASGGMGTVHFGRRNGGAGLSRVVAIKRLHGALARDASCMAMFHDELRLATRVRHPNVIETVDVVEQDGELLLVMDYVQGQSLQQLIARVVALRERIPPAIAVSVVCGILQGLEAVHEAKSQSGEPLGIVHRDVSPENILVGCDGVARLLDFGIARGAGRKHVTRVGELKGKPGYLAPEQILEDSSKVDRRADIYGISVVLWEALTGRRLFDAESVSATLSRVLTEPVPPPSRLVSSLPQGLDEVVLRGLSRDPQQRFASALEMARELRRVCGTLLHFEVGEWLEGVAADALQRQSALVSSLENGGDGYELLELERLLTPPLESAVVRAHRAHIAPALAPRPIARAEPWVDRASRWLAARPPLRRALFGLTVAVFGFSAGLVVVSTALASSHAPRGATLGRAQQQEIAREVAAVVAAPASPPQPKP